MATDPFQVFFRPPDQPSTSAPVKSMTLRLPLRTYEYLEAMAEHADMSRNAMGVQLIEWGVSFALGQLPDELRDQIGEAVEGPDYFQGKGL